MEDCPLATAWRLPDVDDTPPVARPLRVALFCGNYNYVRDGSNQALNRLVAFLEREGCTVRVYSPTSDTPAFPPAGTLISVPSIRIPFRGEYRISRGLPDRVKRDIEAFGPDIIHLSTPDPLNHSAKALGKALGIPVVASFHTRFDTYFRYYGVGWFDAVAKRIMRGFYDGLDEVFVTSEGFGEVLKADGIIDHAAVWSRGVDKLRFNPSKRSLAWRQSLGIADDDVVIGFVGRLVLEKGLDVVAAAAAELKRRGVPHKLLIVGEGPARAGFEAQVPDAIFTGFLEGEQLARAYASADMLLNPSITETFGNINLEAMASGIPIVAAVATGSNCLIDDGVNGRLVPAGDIAGFADALAGYLTDERARKAAGVEGLRRAAGYNWDAINGAVLTRYRELIGA
jgi:glycosyltransferase involved in cell wall biosynthesis